ncbi:DeoR/GlpR family DNA-binding transcription regulator [Streptomyces collinus]|uniref:DeoR/GlpR family DNA-binding transcription regulator n=1 Tax=Streptomyces collinus TaxID=42684 RepID=UPI00369DED81
MTDKTRGARISTILNVLARDGELQVRVLPALLGVSGATVRRDLATLEKNGLIRRSYGKIAAVRRGTELPLSVRQSQNAEAKRRIGTLLSSLLPNRPLTLALSAGSTVGYVAQSLACRAGLTVVTNGLDTAAALAAQHTVKVEVTGGIARPLTHDLVGKRAKAALRAHQFDFAIVGADGICPRAGFTQHSSSGAEIDRIMLEQARHTIVVADSSKLGRVRQAKFADTGAVNTVITDSYANVDMIASLRNARVRTVLAFLP